jgi:hypothetical protein
MKDRQRVSLAALSTRSKEIDPGGRGSLKAPSSRMKKLASTMSNIAVGKLRPEADRDPANPTQ